MRVAGAERAAGETGAEVAAAPEQEDPAPGGYAVLPAAPSRPPTFYRPLGVEAKSHDRPRRTKPVRALVRAPAALETSWFESLLYPLWDATGLSFLIFLPPLLWLSSLPVFGILPLLLRAGGLILVLAPFAFGMVIFFALVLGYVLLFLGRVLVSSALGEVAHPRMPDGDFHSLLGGVGRWLWAALVGVAVGGLPALAYWLRCGDIDLFDRVVLGELFALGAGYSLMALAAALLHDNVWAANPITVVQAICRVGWSYVGPCLLAGFAVMLALGLFALLEQASAVWVTAVGLWLFWVFGLYEAIVVMRVLGLFYRRHAAALGWIRDRPRWGV